MTLTELLYPLQYVRDTLLFNAALRGHTTFVERLRSTLGIDVKVSWSVNYEL